MLMPAAGIPHVDYMTAARIPYVDKMTATGIPRVVIMTAAGIPLKSGFFLWLLRYMSTSSPGQKIGFQIILLKKPGHPSHPV